MLRSLTLWLVLLSLSAPASTAMAKRDTLSSCFFVKRQGNWLVGKKLTLYASSPNGPSKRIAILDDLSLTAGVMGWGEKTPQYAVSDDGRDIVFESRSFGKGTQRVDAGLHHRSCGGGDTLLYADDQLAWTERTSYVNSATFSAAASGGLCFVLRGDSMQLTRKLRPDGTTIPLALVRATPLHSAALYGRLDELDSMLGAGADPTSRNALRMTPLDIALRLGHEEAALRLLDHAHGDSSLIARATSLAVVLGRWRVLAELIRRGTDPNAIVDDRTLLTHTACTRDFLWGRTRHRDEDGFVYVAHSTVGMRSALDRPPESTLQGIRMLLELGANPNLRDTRGLTPLHEVALHRNADAARELVQRGADPSIPSSRGNSALHTLVGTESHNSEPRSPEGLESYRVSAFFAMLELFVAQTKDIDAINEDGLTALQRAIGARNFLAAHYLTEHGASDTVDFYGRTARTILEDEKKNRNGKKWSRFRSSFTKRYAGGIKSAGWSDGRHE